MSRIFRDGANAALGGMCSCKNPYIMLTPAWWIWLDGFNRGSYLLRMGQ